MDTSAGNVQIVPGRNGHGEHVFTVLVKRSYRIAHQRVAERAEHDEPFRLIDAYWDQGEPDWSTVQHESEQAPFKPMTDVVVVGRAHAPRGAPVQQMLAGVAVGERRKLLLVTGDRECRFREGEAPLFTEPLPFTEMEIRYDRAYGGVDEVSDPSIPFHYPRNDRGRGVVLGNVRERIEGLALPNLEDPEDRITPERLVIGDPDHWHLQPVPQGFGWRQRTWYPRCALLGACPPFLPPGTVTAEEREGVLPPNHAALARANRLPPFEAHFNNGASLGLMLKQVAANEHIHLLGLVPGGGQLHFQLPGELPRVTLDLGAGPKPLETTLQTVSIRPDDGALDLIWQAAQVYPGHHWLPQMKRLHAEVQ
jgi:hypothetical protein